MQKITRQEFESLEESFKADKVPYIMYIGQSSSRMETEFGVFYTGDDISMSEMSFVSQSKHYLNKRIDTLNIIKPSKVPKTQFFKLNAIEKGIHEGYVELDLNSAYWTTAYNIGLIENSFYKKGLEKTKKSRLHALGQMGKIDAVFKFNGKRVVRLSDKYNPTTLYMWNLITYTNAKNIQSICEGTDWLFYWVDAIFVNVKDLDLVKARAKSFGYKFKTKKVHHIEVLPKKIIVYTSVKNFKEFNVNTTNKWKSTL